MLTIYQETKVYVYTDYIDMRLSINGLIVLLADTYNTNPQTGDLFIFTNKHRNKIKLLFYDKNGFVMYYKKLDRGKFYYSHYIKGKNILISKTQLKALLMGFDFYLLGQYPREICEDFF